MCGQVDGNAALGIGDNPSNPALLPGLDVKGAVAVQITIISVPAIASPASRAAMCAGAQTPGTSRSTIQV